MRCMWNCFTSTLLLRLKSVRGWVIVLLLPVLTLGALWMLPREEVSAPVRVGVALPEDGGEEFWESLSARSGTVITFIRSDEATIEKMVATSRWDCGLVLSEDFDESLEELDTDRLFSLHIGAGSTVYPLVRETVAACVAELINEEIAEEYLLDSGIISDPELLEEIRPRLEEILPESDRVLVTMSTPDGSSLDALSLADNGVAILLRWMVSAVLLVWLLLSATDLGRWMETPAVRRMRAIRSDTGLMLSRIGADMVLAAAAGCASVLVLGDGLFGCIGIVAYVAFWGMMATILGQIQAVWTALPVVMPFFPVLSLLFSSAIVDIGLFVPAAARISRYLPVSLFLRVCDGAVLPMATLLVMSCVCLLLSCGIERIRRK